MPKAVYDKISEERKHKLLKPALKELLSKPFEKVTVLSLTDRMHILRTDFYYYFQDKFDLYDAIKAHIFKGVEANGLVSLLKEIFKKHIACPKSYKRKLELIDLTSDYDPRSLELFGETILEKCSIEPSVENCLAVKLALFKFMNISNLYLNGKIDRIKAEELLG